jgi:hypothetical protein
MKHGCLAISGLGLISLFVFGVTLEAVNDPKELTAIPFTPWDFLTYGLIALAILALVRLIHGQNSRRTLPGKWTSDVMHERGPFRTALHMDPDGNAEIDTKGKIGGSEKRFQISARWHLSDDKTLHFFGTQSLSWKILKLNAWSMTTAATGGSSSPVHWIKHPKINTKALLMVAAAILLPMFIALSLPRSGPAHAIADDSQFLPPSAPRHGR